MRLARAYLWFGLIASVAFGGACLLAPSFMMGQMGVEYSTPAGLTDLRANYAGYQLGMAALLGWCLRDESRYAAGLVAFACIVGALGLSRLFGLFSEGFSPEMTIATVIEFGMAGFALFARGRTAAAHSDGGS